ncbi:hypothetical protein F9K91_24875 [Brucella tritici]|nr:hypothetical protein F9K91_24875 [Brucella tritici]
MRELYQHPTADEAIGFALDVLQPYEIAEFLEEWRQGIDLRPWCDAAKADGSWQNFDLPLSVEVRSNGDTGQENEYRREEVDKRLSTG